MLDEGLPGQDTNSSLDSVSGEVADMRNGLQELGRERAIVRRTRSER